MNIAKNSPKLFAFLILATLALTAETPYASAQDPSSTHTLTVSAAKLREINVPGTSPMIAADVDLTTIGYTEHEFYANGMASRYRGVLPGTLKTGQLIDNDWPYRTRVLVRAPGAEKFNGFLVVEWANVTTGQDVDFAFAESYKYLLKEGYAVAVVSVQRVGVDRLTTWNPARYGSLSVEADITDPLDRSRIDDCGFPIACPGDPLSWDIMTQVSRALKDNTGEQPPMPGLKVRHVIALGQSQSALRLAWYYNAIQPLYRFFDGFVFLDEASQLRSDITTPAISVNTQTTADMAPPMTSSEYTRIWAVAGTSHTSLESIRYVDSLVLRDKSFPGTNGPLSFTELMEQQRCRLSPLFSTVHTGYVLNSALESVRQWVESGKAAAPTRAFTRLSSGKIARDTDGNALGGIRLADLLVPTAELSPNGEQLGCLLSGHHRDFTNEELKKRYGTHQAYVAKVRNVTEQVKKEGYLLPPDAAAIIHDAEISSVAR